MLQVDYVQIDVTEDCKAIVAAVDALCGKAGKWSNNYTVNYFVDIFKGSESKKIMDLGGYISLSMACIEIIYLFFGPPSPNFVFRSQQS